MLKIFLAVNEYISDKQITPYHISTNNVYEFRASNFALAMHMLFEIYGTSCFD